MCSTAFRYNTFGLISLVFLKQFLALYVIGSLTSAARLNSFLPLD